MAQSDCFINSFAIKCLTKNLLFCELNLIESYYLLFGSRLYRYLSLSLSLAPLRREIIADVIALNGIDDLFIHRRFVNNPLQCAGWVCG